MIFFCLLTATLWLGTWGVGEVVFVDLPSIINCGEPVQLNWTYVGNASSVFEGASSELYITAEAMSVSIDVQFVSYWSYPYRNPRYPATGVVVRFNAPRMLTTVDVTLGLYGQRLTVGRERTGSTQPNAFKTKFACCPDCCRPGPNECGHVNATFQCAGRLCAPAWCPTPSAAPGLFGCPCSTNNMSYPRCAGVYSCDSRLEHALCSVTPVITTDTRCTVSSDSDWCSQRNPSYTCVKVGLAGVCRLCTPGVTTNCRCDDQRACKFAVCADGRCASIGCKGCPCGRWGTCAGGLRCGAAATCEAAPVNATELCKSASENAAQQCDYALQQSDIDDLLRSAPLDDGLPVLMSPSVAPACAKLRQLLICRARVFDASSTGCVDDGIGATVARLCEAIPAARLAALNCGLCEPEACDVAKPACLRGLACIDGKCIIDPQFAICRNASTLLSAACPDTAKQQDIETVQLAAKVGAMTNVTDTACSALLAAQANRSACFARVYGDASCVLPQVSPYPSACARFADVERIAAIGCNVCKQPSTLTLAPATSGPAMLVNGTTSAVDTNTGWRTTAVGCVFLVISARLFI